MGSGSSHNSIENMATLRKAIDVALESLGGPIHKTIIWHMNNRGLFSDPRNIDIESFYLNLKELVGPGADMLCSHLFAARLLCSFRFLYH